MKYIQAEQTSWLELEGACVYTGVKPRSVHFPLNLPFGTGLIYCDCAFNVYRLPVPPDMSTRDITSRQLRESMQLEMLSFAFDEPAFIPEFRQSLWRRIGGRYPQAHGEYHAWLLQYDLEYAADPGSGAVFVRAGVTNDDDVPRKAVVRCVQSCPQEMEIWDYHYRPFRWDAEHFSSLKPAVNQPEVTENAGWTVESGSSCSFAEADYNRSFGCSRPYIASPSMQLKSGGGLMKFTRELRPGESASFTLAVRFGDSRQPVENSFDAVAAAGQKYWDGLLGDCRAEFGDAAETDLFYALQWNSLQLLLELDSPKLGKVCQPSQGGTSERFYVWVWEAMQCLRPMLRFGYFAPVRRVLEFFFLLQDGGCPPDGRFASLEGAVGTTGPRWANATGSALLLACDYAMLSGDPDFLKEFLPKMTRAARWILNEVKATRRLNPDGTKAVGYGVMPFARATDGDEGYIIASTDSWNFAGVEAFAKLLKQIGSPDSETVAAEVEEYRRNLSDAIDSVRRDDGFIDRKLTDEGRIARVFTICSGSIKFLETGFGDPNEERFRKLIEYYEKNCFRDRFCGPLFDRIHYIGNSEQTMFCAYLKSRQWKKAHLAQTTFRNCGMTPDLYLMQERCSEVDDAFTPWQPNASNNGRYLTMMIRRLYLENGEAEIILLGGVPPSGLLPGKNWSIRQLHTAWGKVDLVLEQGRFMLMREQPFPAGMKFVFPDYMDFQCSTSGVNALPGNVFELETASKVLSGGIALIPERLL